MQFFYPNDAYFMKLLDNRTVCRSCCLIASYSCVLGAVCPLIEQTRPPPVHNELPIPSPRLFTYFLWPHKAFIRLMRGPIYQTEANLLFYFAFFNAFWVQCLECANCRIDRAKMRENIPFNDFIISCRNALSDFRSLTNRQQWRRPACQGSR